MFSEYGQFHTEGDILFGIVAGKNKNVIVPAESEICFPLAYSAGVVLWNMMQIFLDCRN